MKIRPVILCGGAGTRLWPKSKKNQPKQFIDFGGWTLLGKTLERIKDPIFDYPIIRKKDGDYLLKYFERTRKIRRSIITAGQDTAEPNFGRKQ